MEEEITRDRSEKKNIIIKVHENIIATLLEIRDQDFSMQKK